MTVPDQLFSSCSNQHLLRGGIDQRGSGLALPGMQMAAATRPPMMMATGLMTMGPSEGAE